MHFLCVGLTLAIAVGVHGIKNPENFVNLLTGSFTDGRVYSTGNTLPLIGRPWGFNHWAPQTKQQDSRSGSWWFSGNDHTLHWLRCTHQPSPWIGKDSSNDIEHFYLFNCQVIMDGFCLCRKLVTTIRTQIFGMQIILKIFVTNVYCKVGTAGSNPETTFT